MGETVDYILVLIKPLDLGKIQLEPYLSLQLLIFKMGTIVKHLELCLTKQHRIMTLATPEKSFLSDGSDSGRTGTDE